MQDSIQTKTRPASSPALFAAALALLVALAPPSVSASSYSFINNTTGSSSTNLNQVNDSSSVSVTENSTSSSTNNVTLTVDTGHNTITDNTEVGNVSTGNISVDLVVDNEQNTSPSTTGSTWTGSTSTVHSANLNTGANSTNSNNTNLSRTSSVTQNNVANVSNTVNISANTGGNTLSRNTKLGDVTTGSVNINVRLENKLNTPPTTPPVTPPVTPGGVGGGTETPPTITQASISAPTGSPTLVAAANPVLKAPATNRYFAAGSNTAALPLVLLLGLPLMAALGAETGRWLRRRRRADRTLFRSWLLNTWVESALSDGVPLTGLKA